MARSRESMTAATKPRQLTLSAATPKSRTFELILSAQQRLRLLAGHFPPGLLVGPLNTL